MARQIKRFECPVCLESYNDEIVPKLLPCIHTVCHTCLCNLIKRWRGKMLICPVCRSDIKVPKEGAKAFKTNIYLIPDVEPASMTTVTIVCSFCAQEDTAFKTFPCGHQLCMSCIKTAETMSNGAAVTSCPVCRNFSHNEQPTLYPILQHDNSLLQDDPSIKKTPHGNSSEQDDMLHINHILIPEAAHSKEANTEPPVQTEESLRSYTQLLQPLSMQPNKPDSSPLIRGTTLDPVDSTIGPAPSRPVRPKRPLPDVPSIKPPVTRKESNVATDDSQSAIPSAPVLDFDEVVYETILYVDKTLEEETWYVGDLSRKNSLEKLKSYPMLDGLFHVRESSSGTAINMDHHVYTIDLKYHNSPYHVRIYRNADEKYHLASTIIFPKVFDTVQSLIRFHRHQPFVINHKSTGKELAVTLKPPSFG